MLKEERDRKTQQEDTPEKARWALAQNTHGLKNKEANRYRKDKDGCESSLEDEKQHKQKNKDYKHRTEQDSR